MRKSYLVLWGGVIALLLFFWIYFPTLSKYRDLKIQEEGMDKEILNLNTKIQNLAEERNLLKNDPEYLEKVIRDELGLVKPGEVVYKFVQDEPPVPPKPAVANNPVAPAPNAKQISEKEAESSDAEVTPVSQISAGNKSPEVFPMTPVPQKNTAAKKVAAAVAPPPQKAVAVSSEPVYPRQETR